MFNCRYLLTANDCRHFWQAGEDTVYCRQKGVFRTVMDKNGCVKGNRALTCTLELHGLSRSYKRGTGNIHIYKHIESIRGAIM